MYTSGLYYANWTIYAKKCYPKDLPYHQLTHLYYAFFNIDHANAQVVHSDTWADLEMPMEDPRDRLKQVLGAIRQCCALKSLNRSLKLIMSVGGYVQGSNFSAIIDQPHKLDAFADSIVSLVVDLGFDGVDVDYEFPDTSARMTGFAVLLQKLRFRLDAVGSKSNYKYIITTAVPVASDFLERLTAPEIDVSVDLWNIMCYDFVGEWSPATGYHSNVYGDNGTGSSPIEYSTFTALTNYIAKRIPSAKIALGMPLYGRVFRSVDSPHVGVPFNNSIHTPGTVLEPICDYSLLPIGREYNRREVGGCFCYEPSLKQWILYDTIDIVTMKIEVIKHLGLSGGFFWEASSDSKDPLRSLVQAYVNGIGQQHLENSVNRLE